MHGAGALKREQPNRIQPSFILLFTPKALTVHFNNSTLVGVCELWCVSMFSPMKKQAASAPLPHLLPHLLPFLLPLHLPLSPLPLLTPPPPSLLLSFIFSPLFFLLHCASLPGRHPFSVGWHAGEFLPDCYITKFSMFESRVRP